LKADTVAEYILVSGADASVQSNRWDSTPWTSKRLSSCWRNWHKNVERHALRTLIEPEMVRKALAEYPEGVNDSR